MVHSLSKLCNYFNIVLIPTTRWIHMYYFKLNLILLIHNLIIRLIYFNIIIPRKIFGNTYTFRKCSSLIFICITRVDWVLSFGFFNWVFSWLFRFFQRKNQRFFQGVLGFLGFFNIIIKKYIFITIINILILNCYLFNFIYLNNLQN